MEKEVKAVHAEENDGWKTRESAATPLWWSQNLIKEKIQEIVKKQLYLRTVQRYFIWSYKLLFLVTNCCITTNLYLESNLFDLQWNKKTIGSTQSIHSYTYLQIYIWCYLSQVKLIYLKSYSRTSLFVLLIFVISNILAASLWLKNDFWVLLATVGGGVFTAPGLNGRWAEAKALLWSQLPLNRPWNVSSP